MNKPIPYSHQSLNERDIREVVKVLRSDFITQGPKIEEFEEALCAYTGASYAVCVANGTAALHIACLAAGIRKNDEVITSPITFAASANCVRYCGGRPVFVDVLEDTVNIDPQEVRKKITGKTKALIPVHFAGHPVDLDELAGIAKARDLIMIEDAAHALGAVYKGTRIGACRHSDLSILSFHPVKSITTGEGGAVLTNRKDLYERLRLFRNHGITKEKKLMGSFDGPWYYEMQELGFNYRITDLQCALGKSQLARIGSFMKKRNEIAQRYLNELSGIDDILLPVQRDHVRSAWHLFPVRLKQPQRRLAVFEFLRKNNIGVQVHYIPVYLQPYYRELGYREGLCPNAEAYYESEISIPIYPAMTSSQVGTVIRTLRRALRRQ